MFLSRRSIILFILVLLILDIFVLKDRLFKTDEAKNMANTCASSKADWRNCYYSNFNLLTQATSFDHALLVLKDLESIDTKTRNCHLIAHGISTGAMSQNSSAWKDFLKKIDPNYCTGGFIHGVVEGLNKLDNSFRLDEKSLPEICQIVKESVQGKGGDQYCAHISGHLLLVEKAGQVDDAVKICDKVPGILQYQCYGGVFMESITRDDLVLHGVGQKRPTTEATVSDQVNLCNQYQGLTATGCWREIAHMFVWITNSDPQKIFDRCLKAPKEADRMECYLHATSLMVSGPDDALIPNPSVCAPLFKDFKEFYPRCINGVINNFMFLSKNYEGELRSFCEDVDQSYQKACLDYLDSSSSRVGLVQDD